MDTRTDLQSCFSGRIMRMHAIIFFRHVIHAAKRIQKNTARSRRGRAVTKQIRALSERLLRPVLLYKCVSACTDLHSCRICTHLSGTNRDNTNNCSAWPIQSRGRSAMKTQPHEDRGDGGTVMIRSGKYTCAYTCTYYEYLQHA